MNKLTISREDSPINPREDENLGTMMAFHPRYNLGDKNYGYDLGNYPSLHDMVKDIVKNEGEIISLPLYLYDHSGITMNTTGFSCPRDTSYVGIIWVSKRKVREWFNIKKVTKEWVKKIEGYLIGEVKTYDQYLTGDVYGFEIEDDEENIVTECYGFFGTDWKTNGILDYVSRETYFPELSEEEFHTMVEEAFENVYAY